MNGNLMMHHRTIRPEAQARRAALAFALMGSLTLCQTAWGQTSTPQPAEPQPAAPQPTDAPVPPSTDTGGAVEAQGSSSSSSTDIFSRNTVSAIVDLRASAANGETSFLNGGFGKTRYGGGANGDYKARAQVAEADLIWTPRFTKSLTANVSAAYQNDHTSFDLMEAFLNFQPESTGKFSVTGRAGLMWPEISLEHSTGGAWSTVNVITPSAINSWVGEETKVVGLEATLHANLGQNQLLLTGGVFGFNDTSGTLLSFRGWALHDEKATGFSHFPLPPRNAFLTGAQQDVTRSTIDVDKKPGYYLRLDWRPPAPVGVALFYYDNRGDPAAFFKTLQWGWRTRFFNLALNADLGPNTHFLAQGMSGSTIMGFDVNNVPWVHTYFRSAFASIVQDLDAKTALTGRIEAFGTREHGSEMDPALNNEDGWATTVDLRHNFSSHFTGFLEALNVRSRRGMRVDEGLEPFQAQTVFQAALRVKI
jgi:hypothetical protein